LLEMLVIHMMHLGGRSCRASVLRAGLVSSWQLLLGMEERLCLVCERKGMIGVKWGIRVERETLGCKEWGRDMLLRMPVHWDYVSFCTESHY
jgi:hypothetical protein